MTDILNDFFFYKCVRMSCMAWGKFLLKQGTPFMMRLLVGPLALLRLIYKKKKGGGIRMNLDDLLIGKAISDDEAFVKKNNNERLNLSAH